VNVIRTGASSGRSKCTPYIRGDFTGGFCRLEGLWVVAVLNFCQGFFFVFFFGGNIASSGHCGGSSWVPGNSCYWCFCYWRCGYWES